MGALKNKTRLNAKIKKNWDKLSDEEIGFCQSDPDAFYAVLRKKYGILREDAHRRVKQLETTFSIIIW